MNKQILIALALASIFISANSAYVAITCYKTDGVTADANCASCPNSGPATCTACNAGYYLVSGVCTACFSANCASCTDATLTGCTAASGYWKNTASVDACATNCKTCTTAAMGTCTVASDGYFLTGTAPSVTAITGCFANCKTCTDATKTTCSVAMPGYFLTGTAGTSVTAITACYTNCKTCTDATITTCSVPNTGYFLTGTAGTSVTAITQCADTFQATACTAVDTATSCSKGTPGTGICCGVANCATCQTSALAGVTGANAVCATCTAGYTASSGACTCTVTNCNSCPSAAGTCTGCALGYYLASSSSCTACTANCNTCTVAGCAATGCATGYAYTGTGATATCVATTPVASTDSPATSAFNVTPTAVFASTETTAPAFSGVSGAIYGPGFDSSTEYVWAFVVPTTGTISVNRRAINGTYGGALAKLNSSDTAISTAIPYSAVSTLKTAVGLGYLLIASYVAPTNWNGVGGTATAGDVSITYIPVNGTATTKSVAGNTNVNAYFTINAVWYDTGVAYVIYTMSTHTPGTAPAGGTATADVYAYNGIYINGISVSTGATIYNGTTGGIKAIALTASATGTTTGLSCTGGCASLPSGVVQDFQVGGVNITNSSTVNYLWTDYSGTYKVIKTGTITLATGAGTAGTALATEAAATGAASASAASATTPYVTTNYYAGGFLGSSATSGVFINKKVTTYTATSTSTSVYTTLGYINGTTTASNVTAAVVTGYSLPVITGYGTSDGFVLIEKQTNTASSGMTYLVQAERFFTNGSTNGAAVNLGTYNDAPLTHQDGNGSIYLGYTLTNTLSPYGTYSGMLGKYLAQSLASGASTLTSIFAFLSLMIAALFAF